MPRCDSPAPSESISTASSGTDAVSVARPQKPSDGLFWITGASSGIGRELALECVRRGWRVVVTARRADELEALARTSPVPNAIIPAPCDVTDEVAMRALVTEIEARHGRIARAFLNAGVFYPVEIEPFDTAKYHKSFAVNLGGVVNALGAIVPGMLVHGGQIAVNASVAGYTGMPTSAAYGATKAGLINMVESLKFDGDRRGILFQLVNPGFVETPATAQNAFEMPYLMPVDEAARRIADGLDDGRFEIFFPRRFAWQLKFLAILPYRVY
ncbi:MAG: SDR family NAD(P)-dependent oxidoreductase, partial [Methylobacterium sp.]|nr:SDR family NAD(P)-dependent oxidoreductase [Methylobacterium sp.]